jgi:hypothetical protein
LNIIHFFGAGVAQSIGWANEMCRACYIFMLVSCLAFASTLQMEAKYSSETSVDFEEARTLVNIV